MTNLSFDRSSSSISNISFQPIVGRSFTILKQGFWRLFIFALIAGIPSFIPSHVYHPIFMLAGGGRIGQNILVVLDVFINVIFRAIASVFLFCEIFQILRGKKASIFGALKVWILCVIPALLLSVLSFMAVSFGLLLLVFPGVAILCMTYILIPICVLERPGIISAFRRSVFLTRGHKGDILPIMVLPIVFGVFLLFASLPIKVLGTLILGHLFHMGIVFPDVVDAANWAIYAMVSTALQAIVYHDLRVLKEGVDTRQMAAIFDDGTPASP